MPVAINGAFQQTGLAFSFTTSGTINTSQSRFVKLSDITGSNSGPYPSAARFHNSGTVPVWVNFTNAAGTVAAPTAGTTTVGTPTQSTPLYPGLVEVFILPLPWITVNGVVGFFMQDVSGTASQSYEVIFGEGM